MFYETLTKVRTITVTLFALLFSLGAFAQQRELPIWPGKPPGTEGWTHRPIYYSVKHPTHGDTKLVRNISIPTLMVFAPDPAKANGTGIIVCPGGAFRILAWENEGTQLAQWLAARGITAFVLKYRLDHTPEEEQAFAKYNMVGKLLPYLEKLASTGVYEPLDESEQKIVQRAIDDGKQAVRYVRQRAGEWKLSANRIGIVGFSAGAWVVMGTVMNDDASSRPNFAAPIYGGLTFGRPAPANAPPLFIALAQDDPIKPIVVLSRKIHATWSEAGFPAELHIFAKGGHGFGMARQNLPSDHWIDLFGYWLDFLGM